MTLGQHTERLFPTRLTDEVRHDKKGGTPADLPGGRFKQFSQSGCTGRSSAGAVLHRVQQVQHVLSAAPRWYDFVDTCAVQHGPDAVAVARKHTGQSADKVVRYVALALLARAKVH